VQIDYRLRYAHTHTHAQPIVIYSRFIEMCAWAYGTIYSWRLEMDLKSLLESLFQSLLESLLERTSHREE
jgi:hypothetical protein